MSADAGALSAGRRLLLVAAPAAATVAADQLSKWWALESLDDRTIHVVWTLRLNLTFNAGSAFSLVSGRFIPIVALAVVVALAWTGRTIGRVRGAIGLGVLLGGALGNLTDRAFRSGDGFLGGRVIDFIDLQWWPVFNVADIAVVVGAGLLLLDSWLAEHR